MDTNMENCNGTNMENCNGNNEQEYRKNLYELYLHNGETIALHSCSQYITQTQQEKIEFLQQLKAKRLPANKCMAAYYVLVDHKHFDPSDVKSALLAWCDPEELIKCETQEELIEETTAVRLAWDIWDIGVYDAVGNLYCGYDSPYLY